MTIRLPEELPAFQILRNEGLGVLPPDALRPVGQPQMRVALLNLMPDKPRTETQFARLLADTIFDVELILTYPDDHTPKRDNPEHMGRFYQPLSKVMEKRIDGLLVTGAPVERLPFEDVTYWPQLTQMLDWAEHHVARSLFICWAGQAALKHRHGIDKSKMRTKRCGVYPHRIVDPGALSLRGMAQEFPCPVSRHTDILNQDIVGVPGLHVLVDIPGAGPAMIEDRRRGALYMFDHLEYDADTLSHEFTRDIVAGLQPPRPRNYFPNDCPNSTPINTWHETGRQFIGNWLNDIYATMIRAAA